MRAVKLVGTEAVAVQEVSDPSLADDTDAIVRVTHTAICGADLLPYHGYTPGFELGTTLGHEFVGVVHDAGDALGALKPGQRVVNTSMTSDGTCAHCRAGRPDAVRVAGPVRLLRRLPAARGRTGRSRAGAAGRPLPVADPRRRLGRGRGVRRGHPADWPSGRPARRGRCGRRRRRARLWAGGSDGADLRRRHRAAGHRGRRDTRPAGAGPARSAPRRSIRRPHPRLSQPRPRRSEPMR